MKLPKFGKLEFGDRTEIERREREVQLLLNVIEPDPKFQPTFLSDASVVGQCTRNSEKVTEQRLKQHFGDSFIIDVHMTFPDFIDAVKKVIPNWPDHRRH